MFSKPNAIVYLRRNNILVGGKQVPFVKQVFTTDLINNLEIVSKDKFVDCCRDFFSSRDIRSKRVLIVLDQSIVFSKTIEITDTSKDASVPIVDDFVSAMPFEPGKRVCVQFVKGNTLQLFATNADLYNALIESLRMINIKKLIAITPAEAYSIDYSGKPSVVIDQLMDDRVVRQTYDFSTVTPF